MSKFDLHLGNCLDVLKGFPAESVDAIVTDPPYGLSFMAKKWDYDVPGTEIWAECLRVLKPEGNLLCFAGTRTQHRMVARVVEAGFTMQDAVLWAYGCLSEDTEVLTKEGWMSYGGAIGKDIQIFDVGTKECKWETPSQWYTYKVENDVAYNLRSEDTDQIVSKGHRCLTFLDDSLRFTIAEELGDAEAVPVLDEHGALHRTQVAVCEVRYSGVFWCPTVSTGAFVARRNGKVFITGNSGFPKSLNISRAIDKELLKKTPPGFSEWLKAERESKGLTAKELCEIGKFYKNVNHGGLVSNWEAGIGSPDVEQFNLLCDILGLPFEKRNKVQVEILGWRKVVPGVAFSSEGPSELPVTPSITDAAKQWEGWHTALKPSFEPVSIYTKGGCLTLYNEFKRLYYCAKASKRERNMGLKGKVSAHPTVKPLKLMESLCELATPKGGVILDPFMGSGTTGIAALNLGFDFIGIEMGEEYFDIAQTRLNSLHGDPQQ